MRNTAVQRSPSTPSAYIKAHMEKKRSRSRRLSVCPAIGALLRYRTRVVRVVAEACGQRAMIESRDTTGRTFVSTVKWGSLRELGSELF